jgi:hypothetical protein
VRHLAEKLNVGDAQFPGRMTRVLLDTHAVTIPVHVGPPARDADQVSDLMASPSKSLRPFVVPDAARNAVSFDPVTDLTMPKRRRLSRFAALSLAPPGSSRPAFGMAGAGHAAGTWPDRFMLPAELGPRPIKDCRDRQSSRATSAHAWTRAMRSAQFDGNRRAASGIAPGVPCRSTCAASSG